MNLQLFESRTADLTMPPEVGAGALLSDDKAFRFALWRRWDSARPMVMLIGLNPSTANESTNDPTITRLAGIPGKPGLAARNGFGGFFMMNLFPFITPYPGALEKAWAKIPENDWAKIPENDWAIQAVNLHCQSVVFCWGNFKTYGRDRQMMAMFPSADCFGKNQSGTPKHPLYLKGDTKLQPFFELKELATNTRLLK